MVGAPALTVDEGEVPITMQDLQDFLFADDVSASTQTKSQGSAKWPELIAWSWRGSFQVRKT